MAGNLFVLTASSSEAYQHYVDTLERGFTLDSIKSFLTSEQVSAVHNLHGDGPIHAWGAVPGPGNIGTWEKMNVGDAILIYRKGYIEYYALVTFKLHNPALARHLWTSNTEGKTWEYMYFLQQMTEVSMPLKIYNEVVGNVEHFRPQGYTRVSSEKTKVLEHRFGSIEKFLNYLGEGKWVEQDPTYSPAARDRIVQERTARHVGKTKLLEANLEDFVADRPDLIEPGLKLVGQQVDTKEVGRLDLLCQDKDGDLVVVELKRGAAGPSIIDQTQRYMGWAMKRRAHPGQKVRGVIVVGAKDTALEYAVMANPMIQVKEFNLSIK